MSVIFNKTLEQVLASEEAQLVRELEQLPQFRRLGVVRKTIADLRAIGTVPTPAPETQTNDPRVFSAIARPQKGRKTATSIGQAVAFALEDAGQPIATRQLLEDIRRYGRAINAKNKVWGLSNTLSSDERFQSVPWGEARAWWFAGRDVPAEIEEKVDEGGGDITATA